MSGINIDLSINIPMVVTSALFLFTIGNRLGSIAQKLETLHSWRDNAGDKLDSLESRISHMEGRLGGER